MNTITVENKEQFLAAVQGLPSDEYTVIKLGNGKFKFDPVRLREKMDREDGFHEQLIDRHNVPKSRAISMHTFEDFWNYHIGRLVMYAKRLPKSTFKVR